MDSVSWCDSASTSPLLCIQFTFLLSSPLPSSASLPRYSGLSNTFTSSTYPFLSSFHLFTHLTHACFFSDNVAHLWRRKFKSLIRWNDQIMCHNLFTLKNAILVSVHSFSAGSPLQLLSASFHVFLLSLSIPVTFLLELLSSQLMYLSSAFLSSCWLQLVNAWLIS